MTGHPLPESALLHYARRMKHDEIRSARLALGLSQSELARLLDTDTKTVSRLEMRPESATYRTPAPRTVRLLQAYLAGYRPPDWPPDSTGSRPGPKKRLHKSQ
jgi:DNA-binding transcriptional regulator YiaG